MFRPYQPRGKELKLDNDMLRIDNSDCKFNEEVWEKLFNRAEKVRIFYEEESGRIGLKGDSSGNKVMSKAGYKFIHWTGFLKAFKITFPKAEFKKVERIGDLVVISSRPA